MESHFNFPGAGLFQFITFRAAAAFILALSVSTIYGKRIINFLRTQQVGESIRDLGLEGQIGLFGASVGVKYYFLVPKIKSVNFSIGTSPGYGITGVRAYFPIAVNFWSQRNYRYSFDIGPNISLGNEDTNVSFSFKIGKGF